MDAKIMAKILLAEDEQNIASFIRRGLQEFGHEVQVAQTEARHGLCYRKEFSICLCWMSLCRRWTGLRFVGSPFEGRIPYTGHHADGVGHDRGYRKGVGCRGGRLSGETVQFPRTGSTYQGFVEAGKRRPDRQLWCHDLVLDCDTRRARRGDTVIELTVKEYRLLEYFMTHQGWRFLA